MNIPEIDLPVYEAMWREFCIWPLYAPETWIEELVLSDMLNYRIFKKNNCAGSIKDFVEDIVFRKWDLSLPYYSQQSEETKAFIRSLL